LANGQRGKFYKSDIELNLPVNLEPDIKVYFPDSNTVNGALRCLLPILRKNTIKPSTKRIGKWRRFFP